MRKKFAQARLLYFYMLTHPGKKLNFMGSELAHFREWDEDRSWTGCCCGTLCTTPSTSTSPP